MTSPHPLSDLVREMREKAGLYGLGNLAPYVILGWASRLERALSDAVVARPMLALLDEFDAYAREKIENCSDRHCMLGSNPVGTNGGCKCWDDRNKMRRYLPAARQLHKKLRAMIEAAERQEK